MTLIIISSGAALVLLLAVCLLVKRARKERPRYLYSQEYYAQFKRKE